MSQNIKFDVVIVGGGIAGSALACALDNKNLSVLLIEAHSLAPQPDISYSVTSFDPRVSALTAASESFLNELSVWNTIMAQRAGKFNAMHVFDGEGTGHIEFTADDIHEERLGHIVENSHVVYALQQRLSFSANVKLLENTQISHISKNESGYRIECESSVNDKSQSSSMIEATLLVGADGANSFVRHECGFTTREWSYEHHAVVCTVETAGSHQQTAWQSFTQFGPLAFLPLASEADKNNFSSIVWSLEPEEADRVLSLDDAQMMLELTRAIEQKCGKVIDISKRFSFPLRQRHAVCYAKPSVVLVGDAAHTIHPLAGQGINLGLKDVKALSEEIIKAVDTHLAINDEAVLKRYERRRKGDNLAMMAVMEGFKRIYGRKDLLSKFVRNRGMDSVNRAIPLKKRIIKQAMGL